MIERLISGYSQVLVALLVIVSMGVAHAVGMNSVTVSTSKGDVEWSVELASDDAARSTGLMHRSSMDRRSGMLFRFDDTRPVAMWMKNTFIPLDMIFANEAGVVTHIHRGAVPQSTDIISSQGPVRYVLEINAGEADETGIKPGDKMQHPWFPPSN